MDHHNFAELYTQVKILSLIKIDDSISDIQHKSSFSFVTTQKAINKLEKKQLIRTEKKIGLKGKSRQCIWFSRAHHIFCTKFLFILNQLDLYLNNEIIVDSNVQELTNELQQIKVKKDDKQAQSTLELFSEN